VGIKLSPPVCSQLPASLPQGSLHSTGSAYYTISNISHPHGIMVLSTSYISQLSFHAKQASLVNRQQPAFAGVPQHISFISMVPSMLWKLKQVKQGQYFKECIGLARLVGTPFKRKGG